MAAGSRVREEPARECRSDWVAKGRQGENARTRVYPDPKQCGAVSERGDNRLYRAGEHASAAVADRVRRRSANSRRCVWRMRNRDAVQAVLPRLLRVGGVRGDSVCDVRLLIRAAISRMIYGVTWRIRDTPHWRRCRPSFLNQAVQVGTVGVASGFPLDDGLAQQPRCHIPWVEIRLKKIPRP